MKKFLTLNDIGSYNKAFESSNHVWDLILSWDSFPKNTLGTQFSRAVDSISANIAEGFGRYSKKDKIRFYRIGFGSVLESLDWTEKAFVRKLISAKDYEEIKNNLSSLLKEINYLIKFTNEKLKN